MLSKFHGKYLVVKDVASLARCAPKIQDDECKNCLQNVKKRPKSSQKGDFKRIAYPLKLLWFIISIFISAGKQSPALLRRWQRPSSNTHTPP
ncbi:Uncharacterised protein [Moraxella caviae]|uniref:Uncharacterized protein n=1 Tax=Moraxella caviae TaxID=34060 RepID=A0A378R5L7_9GAMM|nr:Uncharacterised protein [Moraxella caviae]